MVKTGPIILTSSVLLAIAFIVGAFILTSGPAQQSVVGGDGGTNIITVESTGDTISVPTTLYNKAHSDPTTTVTSSVDLYTYGESGSGYTKTANPTATQTTKTNVNTKTCAIAFQVDNYYGFETCYKPKTNQDVLNVPVFAIGGLKITFWGNDTTSGSAVTGQDIAAGSKTIDQVRVEMNYSNAAYNFKGIFIDVDSNTNLTGDKVALNSPTEFKVNDATYRTDRLTAIQDSVNTGAGSGETLIRNPSDIVLARTTLKDIVYDLKTPVLLLQYDKVYIPGMTLTASSGTTGESVVLYAFDWAPYVSIDGKSIKWGVETDASSPADVGGNDFSASFTAG